MLQEHNRGEPARRTPSRARPAAARHSVSIQYCSRGPAPAARHCTAWRPGGHLRLTFTYMSDDWRSDRIPRASVGAINRPRPPLTRPLLGAGDDVGAAQQKEVDRAWRKRQAIPRNLKVAVFTALLFVQLSNAAYGVITKVALHGKVYACQPSSQHSPSGMLSLCLSVSLSVPVYVLPPSSRLPRLPGRCCSG
jgi:hypothetical protein